MKPLLRVEWLDAHGVHSDWEEIKDIDENFLKPCYNVTVGFLMLEQEEYIVLAQTKTLEGPTSCQACGMMTIPKCCIKQRRTLL